MSVHAIEPVSVLLLAFQSDAVQAELSLPLLLASLPTLLRTWHLLARQVTVAVRESGLCCCVLWLCDTRHVCQAPLIPLVCGLVLFVC